MKRDASLRIRLTSLAVATIGMLMFMGPWPAASSEREGKGGATNRQAAPASELVWPPPPDSPRIRYLTQFSKASEVGDKKVKKGWFERLAGTKEEREQQLAKPYGIAVDSRDRVYVADTVGVIQVFDLRGRRVFMIAPAGPFAFGNPVGVAVDDRDRLFVSDAQRRGVIYFDPEGKPLGMFGGKNLRVPVGIAVDSKRGRVYVTDVKAHRLAVFDLQTLNFLEYIGEPGDKEGQFNRPAYVAVDRRGFVYVTDMHNHRVQIFNRRGKFVRAFGEHCATWGCFSKPKGIAVDSEGHIYVADAEFNNFQIFDEEGNALLFVGHIGLGPGEFTLLTGLYIDRNDRIYTTEQLPGRVQVFEYLHRSSSKE